jgi:predicted carbohydrate-binding protein with CBM5 and CBM33 domain
MTGVSLLQISCLAGLLLQLVVYAPSAEGHAVMLNPISRQWDDYLIRYNYNPHAINAGGELKDNTRIKGNSCG